MKIAYIITTIGIGGAEVLTVDIANRMVRGGNKVMLLYLLGGAGANSLIPCLDSQVEVISLGLRKSFWSFWYFIKALIKTHALFKKFRPDLIHAQMFHANIFARILRLLYYRPKLICTEHNKNIESEFRLVLYRFTNCLSDLNTNVSKEAVNYFFEKKAFKRSNSRVVYNYVDLSKFVYNETARQKIRQQYDIEEDDFLFINVGRLTEQKDQYNLIEAFSTLTGAKLIIAGMGELLSDLKQFAIDKGVASKVIFAGVHKNIEDYYNAADCFVLSSLWEGLPVAFLEAMASSLPIITTDVSDCREIIDNDEFVVPSHDNIQLAAKMRQIQTISSIGLKEIGERNRKKASSFDIVQIVAEWMSIYTSIVQKSL